MVYVSLTNVQTSWAPLPCSTDFQGTLPVIILNSPKSALWKSKVVVLLIPFLTSPRIENPVILWSLCPRQLLTTTSMTIPFLLINSRSNGVLPLLVSLSSCVRKLSSTHARNLPDCFPPGELGAIHHSTPLTVLGSSVDAAYCSSKVTGTPYPLEF